MENDKLEWAGFERSWTRLVIDSINKVRAASGLTVKDLGDRLRGLGWPVSNATLSGMLSGDKRGSISISEIAVFARALSVTPSYLILGLPSSEMLPEHKMWPHGHNDPYWVYSWFTGPKSASYEEGDPAVELAASKATSLATYFLHRTDALSRYIWTDLAELVALSEMPGVDESWKAERVADTQEALIQDLAALRRLRIRHLELSDSNPLADVKMLPLPEGLEFVDSDESIAEAVQAIPQHVLKKLPNRSAVATATKRLESKYDKERPERRTIED